MRVPTLVSANSGSISRSIGTAINTVKRTLAESPNNENMHKKRYPVERLNKCNAVC